MRTVLRALFEWLVAPYRTPFYEDHWHKDQNYVNGLFSTESHKLYGGFQIFLGVVVLAYAIGIYAMWMLPATVFLWSLWPVALVGVVIIGRLYYLAYGWPPSTLKHRDLGFVKANLLDLPNAVAFSAAFFVWGMSGLLAFLADLRSQPVSIVGLWLALTLLVVHLSHGTAQEDLSQDGIRSRLQRRRLSSHYLVFAVLVFGTSFLPLLGIVKSDNLYVNDPVFGLTTGSILIVGGALDHFVLRLISPPPNQPHNSSEESEERHE